MSKLDDLIRGLCPDGVEYKNWVKLQQFLVEETFRRRIFYRGRAVHPLRPDLYKIWPVHG